MMLTDERTRIISLPGPDRNVRTASRIPSRQPVQHPASAIRPGCYPGTDGQYGTSLTHREEAGGIMKKLIQIPAGTSPTGGR
jgi:hypothetical protein